MPFCTKAQSDEGFKKKTLLILNSYNEQSLWSRTLIAPIALYVAKDDNLHAELFSLNNVLITDSTTYNQAKDNFFETFKDKKPDYMVIIGGLAFSFRDEIKEHWGDIPILLVTRDLTLAPTWYFFSGYDNSDPLEAFPSVADLRESYNFSAIYVPDFYRETIDMMSKMIPDMEELIFFSDPIYLNRNLAHNIEMYLYENHPEVKFKWVQASAERPDELQHYFVTPMPKSGLLMSTWFYDKKNAFGNPSLVSGDMNLLNASVNPVFSLRRSDINLGSIGGIYTRPDSVNAQLVRMLDAMVAGKSMRDIKFITNKYKSDYCPIISYPKLKEFGINPNKCPDNTHFLDRPLSFWQKNLWYILAFVTVFVLTVTLFVRHARSQRKEIELLEEHRNFVDKMLVAFSKAKIVYDDEDNVVNIKYIHYNETFARILKNNCYCTDPYLIFPNEFIAQKTTELLKSHNSVSFKYYFDKTDRYYIFTLCFVGARIINERELVDEVDIFAIDVTARQKTEEQLRVITDKLDRTLDVAEIIPWEWRINKDELEFDAYSLFERGEHSIGPDGKLDAYSSIMRPLEFIQTLHPDDRDTMINVTHDLLDGKCRSFKTEVRIRVTREGKDAYEWVESHGAVSEYDADGKPTVVLGSLKVITERKNQEAALVDARERALESDKLKSSFLANMSHEIRTPLNAIVGFSSLICETDDADKRRQFSEIINQNSDMLLALVNDVLDLAKIESNSLEMYVSEVDLNAMLNTIRETAKVRVHKDVKLNLVTRLPSCHVMLDGNRVSQVLINLLTNAAKFTTQGSITFGYDIIDNKEIYFYVKDTGIGISAENQKRLFTRFDKINNFMPGNGLGLSISKSLVEKMGGNIGMRSRGEGKGSTFWFDLPYQPVENPSTSVNANVKQPYIPPVQYQAPINETKHAKDGAPLDPNRKKVILVAEDIEGNFLLIKHLVPEEYRLVHAWDGKEAIDLFKTNQPDLVLMDISMPIMDGYQATDEIRRLNDQVPIVAVTAFAYASDRKRILKSGFNDYLSKPVIREDLLELLKRYL